MLKALDCWKKINSINRNISMCHLLLKKDESSTKNIKRKVTETVQLVQLVDRNDKILGLKAKLEAEKLAKKLNLVLERVTDTKYGTMYPAYKMFTKADLLKEEKKNTTAKVMKKLPLNSRISDHDLSNKMNIVRKWLNRNCEVHVTILRNNESATIMKNVLEKIQEEIKTESRLVNVRQTEEAIKFVVIAPKQTANKNKPQNKDENEKPKEDDSS